jgi:hypothetical protein
MRGATIFIAAIRSAACLLVANLVHCIGSFQREQARLLYADVRLRDFLANNPARIELVNRLNNA